MNTLDQVTKAPCTPVGKAEGQKYRVDFQEEKQSGTSTLNFAPKGDSPNISHDKSASIKKKKIINQDVNEFLANNESIKP